MAALRLTEIWIYPIKSLGGIRLTEARVLEKGLAYDRRWMLVDETGRFLTQRILPQMALFKISLEGDFLIGTHKNVPSSHKIALLPSPQGDEEAVVIWDDTVVAKEVDKVSSNWFSQALGQACKLVYFPEVNSRPVDTTYARNNEQVSLADGYPFLIIGEASLQDLNNRLETPLPMNRFRPNFVFSGGMPFEEDTWKNFTIGTNRFVGVKPCSRCVLTTVNQDTAEKGIEPLRTLATYRSRNNKIYFGQNLLAIDHGTVCEGDLVTVDSWLK